MPETPELRSFIMRQIKSKDTRPEMAVRRLVFGLGYRYRLHRKTLPGRPDLAFIARKKAIFVNGCFWHGHDCPAGRRVPRTNRGFWVAKIARNREREPPRMHQGARRQQPHVGGARPRQRIHPRHRRRILRQRRRRHVPQPPAAGRPVALGQLGALDAAQPGTVVQLELGDADEIAADVKPLDMGEEPPFPMPVAVDEDRLGALQGPRAQRLGGHIEPRRGQLAQCEGDGRATEHRDGQGAEDALQ